jgi:hypothetical protein
MSDCIRSIEYNELPENAQLDGLLDPYIARMIKTPVPRALEIHNKICSLEQRISAVWNRQHSRTSGPNEVRGEIFCTILLYVKSLFKSTNGKIICTPPNFLAGTGRSKHLKTISCFVTCNLDQS